MNVLMWVRLHTLTGTNMAAQRPRSNSQTLQYLGLDKNGMAGCDETMETSMPRTVFELGTATLIL